MTDFERELQQAQTDLAALKSELASLPDAIRDLTRQGRHDVVERLATAIARRDVLPNLIAAAEINVLRCEMQLCFQQANEVEQQIPEARTRWAAASREWDTAQRNLSATQGELDTLQADERYLRNRANTARRKMEDMISQSGRPLGPVVRSAWQIH